MNKYYCVSCLCNKPHTEFTGWLSDRTKSRSCDTCKDKEHQHKLSTIAQSEREAKSLEMKNKKQQPKPDKAAESAKRREVRVRLYELAEKRRLAREFEL